MGIVWIILGSLLDFFGVIGFVMIAVGDAPSASFLTYLVLFLLGTGLIALGTYLLKKRKAKRAMQATSVPSIRGAAQTPTISVNAAQPSGGYGIVSIHWKKVAMAVDAPLFIRVDHKPVHIAFFSSDSTAVVPLPGGEHVLHVTCGLHNVNESITAAPGCRCEYDLIYSRSAGAAHLAYRNICVAVDESSIGQEIARSAKKQALLNEVDRYTAQGYPVRSFADTVAVVSMNKVTNGLIGAIPALVEAVSNKTILEVLEDGTVRSTVVGKDSN